MCKMFKKVFIVVGILLIMFAAIGGYNYYSSKDNTLISSPLRTDIKIILYSLDGCRYCVAAEEFLKKKSIPYDVIKLRRNNDLATKLFNQTGQRTVPYVFVNDKFIGGYQDLVQLDEEGNL